LLTALQQATTALRHINRVATFSCRVAICCHHVATCCTRLGEHRRHSGGGQSVRVAADLRRGVHAALPPRRGRCCSAVVL
jgi:hypothetical protein